MSHDGENDFEMNRQANDGGSAGLAQALRDSRPVPDPGFTERLDQAVDYRFPPGWVDEAALGGQGRGSIGSLVERFRRRLGGRRILLPAVAGFAGLLLVATVVVGAANSGRSGGGGTQSRSAITDPGPAGDSVKDLPADGSSPEAAALATPDSAASDSAASSGIARPEDLATGLGGRQRDVAREATITLGTDPDGVQDVANEVISVTDDHNGIVMDSEVTDGQQGTAGASFSLMIPSGQIESAVAELSAIADLRSRSQELTDITAPTNSAEEQVADSEAKIRSLLGELEDTYNEDERTEIEQKIRWERQQKRWAETRLNRLERRADYTPVKLQIETGDESLSDDGSSSWGLSDGIDEAARLLGIAAGVTVLVLSVAIPTGIVVLIALGLNHAWVRRSRRRALADDE